MKEIQDNKETTIKKYLAKHWALKICSLLIALILFVYVYQSKYEVKTIEIQVDMVAVPPDLLFVHKPEPYLNVTFRGASENIQFDTSNFRIVLENPSPKPGINIYRAKLIPEPPPGIDASFKQELKILLDQKITRTLPIVHNLVLVESEEFTLGYVRLHPRTITLTGPYETLAKIDKVKTNQQMIQTQEEFIYSQNVLIEELPDFVEPTDDQTIEVEINVHILRLQHLKEFSNIATKQVRCLNKLGSIKYKIIGQESIKLYLDENIDMKNPKEKAQINALKVYIYCPVFFDEKTKRIMPSFTFNQSIFILDSENNESINVLAIQPHSIQVQFEINKDTTPL